MKKNMYYLKYYYDFLKIWKKYKYLFLFFLVIPAWIICPIFSNAQNNLNLNIDFNAYKLQGPMEHALNGVTELEELFNNPDALNNYYKAVNEYYGQSIDYENFMVIVKQLQEIVRDNPEVGRRLLNKNKSFFYTLKLNLPTYGRLQKQPQFNKVVTDLFGLPENAFHSIEEVLQAAKPMTEDVSDFKSQTINDSRSAKKRNSREFVLELQSKHQDTVSRILGYFYYHNEKVQKLLQLNDVDVFLYLINKGLADIFSELPELNSVRYFILAKLPSVEKLLKNLDAFPVEYHQPGRKIIPVVPTKSSEYRFVNYIRPIHSIWKGIWLKECLSQCGNGRNPLPTRYLVDILSQTTVTAVERNSSYIGFINEFVNVHRPSGRKYISTEFGVPDFKYPVLLTKNEDGQVIPYKEIFVNEWLKKIKSTYPRVKSNSKDVNNADVWEALEDSLAWNLRYTVGYASDFEFADQEMANYISAKVKEMKIKTIHNYGDSIITDFSVRSATTLFLLGHFNLPNNFSELMTYILRPDFNIETFESLIRLGWGKYLFEMDIIDKLFNYFQDHNPAEMVKILNVITRYKKDFSSVQNKYMQILLKNKNIQGFQRLLMLRNISICLNDSNYIISGIHSTRLTAEDVEKFYHLRNIFSELTYFSSIELSIVKKVFDENIDQAIPVIEKNFSNISKEPWKSKLQKYKNSKIRKENLSEINKSSNADSVPNENNYLKKSEVKTPNSNPIQLTESIQTKATDSAFEHLMNQKFENIFRQFTEAHSKNEIKNLNLEMDNLLKQKFQMDSSNQLLIFNFLKSVEQNYENNVYHILSLLELSSKYESISYNSYTTAVRIMKTIRGNTNFCIEKGVFRSMYEKNFDTRSESVVPVDANKSKDDKPEIYRSELEIQLKSPGDLNNIQNSNNIFQCSKIYY